MTSELVGPLPTVTFLDGTRIVADVPKDTMDPRYPNCTNHHTACVCREAELQETIGEYRALHRETKDAAEEILAGHRTFTKSYTAINGVWWRRGRLVTDEVELDDGAVCLCTGCQIARKAYLR